MALRTFQSPFMVPVCDICGEEGDRLENAVLFSLLNAAVNAGWWRRDRDCSDQFLACPDCRERLAPKEKKS